MVIDPTLLHATVLLLVLAPLSGLLGYIAVVRNNMFEADTLSHVGFTGAFLGLTIGLALVPSIQLAVSAIAALFAIRAIKRPPSDVTTSVIFTMILGFGALLTHRLASGHSSGASVSLTSVAFGSLFALTSTHVYWVIIELLITTAMIMTIFRPLLFVAFDSEGAHAAALPGRLIVAIYFLCLGITIAVSTQAIGAFVALALLATPATCVQRFTFTPRAACFFSALLSLCSALTGLLLAWSVPTLSPSVAIVAVTTLIFIVTVVVTTVRQRVMPRSISRT